jgi:hypothetical protein
MAAVLEACRLGKDLRPAAEEVAAQCARDGESLDTFLHGLGACLAAEGMAPPDNAMWRSVSLAWADAYSARYDRITCVDEVSGLHSVQHLQSHVRVLLTREPSRTLTGRHAGASRYVLLVAELPVELMGPPHRAMLRDELRCRTPPGTVLAALSGRRYAALLVRRPAAGELAGQVDRSLADRMEATARGHRPRVWVEGLPHEIEGASQLIAELAR